MDTKNLKTKNKVKFIPPDLSCNSLYKWKKKNKTRNEKNGCLKGEFSEKEKKEHCWMNHINFQSSSTKVKLLFLSWIKPIIYFILFF